MKKILLLLAALALPALSVTAREYKLPKEEPVFSLKFPDKWEVTYEDESVDGVSEDGAIEIYAQTDNAETIEDSVEESLDWLAGEGVKIKPDTEKKTDGEHNGMPMGTIGWKGTDTDGDCSVSLIFLQVDAETTMTLIYWATDSEVKKHEKDIHTVLESMKSLKADGKGKAKKKAAAKETESETETVEEDAAEEKE